MTEPPPLIMALAKQLYRQRAGLFYAGLPIPPWDTLTDDVKQSHIDYVEKKAVEIFNKQFEQEN